MKLVLLEPPSFNKSGAAAPNYHTPHIGLALLAATLQKLDHDISIIDPIAEKLSTQECMDKIRTLSPRAIGITAMTHNIMDAGKTAAAVKNILPDSFIITGGLHATIAPEETLQMFSHIDFIISGDGEIAFPALLANLENGNVKPPPDAPGVWFRSKDGIVSGNGRAPFTEPSDYPFPVWDLFPLDSYTPLYGLRAGERHLPVFTSRGCPFSCSFCNNINSRKMRYRPLESVLEELETDVFKFNVGSIRFIDEAITYNTEFATAIFEGMIKRGISDRAEWLCMTRTDKISPEILLLMKKAGCRYISVGIESGNQDVLDRTGKKIKLSEARAAVDMITKAGITADALFLIGLPYDTPATIRDTIKFARKLNTKHASFSNVIPFPGTEVYEMGLRGEGGVKLLSTDWSVYERHFSYPMELESVSARKLKFFHLAAYLSFYITPGRIMEFFKKVNIKSIPSYIYGLLSRSVNEE